MKVGFTGTQKGMTEAQARALTAWLIDNHPEEVHHGDCIGSDMQFHNLIRRLLPKTEIAGHPPIRAAKRAFCVFDRYFQKKPYLIRNHNIVDCTEILLATPETAEEKLRSGTWATIRYAEQMKREIVKFNP